MAGQADQIKGRVKKAAGELTGNQRLKNEGAIDEAAGNVKEFTSKTTDKIKRALRS